jgi:hypothetical protein
MATWSPYLERKKHMSDIRRPEKYLPGTTDNYVSNEVIIAGLASAQVWPYLNDTTHWPMYNKNASEIGFEDGAGPELAAGVHLRFTTFGMKVEAEVTEYAPPSEGNPARVSFRAWIAGSKQEDASALHASLIEDLAGGRVRFLTQESQIGEPAKQMAVMKPNPVLNAHQDWLEGLVQAAAAREGKEPKKAQAADLRGGMA